MTFFMGGINPPSTEVTTLRPIFFGLNIVDHPSERYTIGGRMINVLSTFTTAYVLDPITRSYYKDMLHEDYL